MHRAALLLSVVVLVSCRSRAPVGSAGAPVPTAPRRSAQAAHRSAPRVDVFEVEPLVIELNQSAQLRWHVIGAAKVSILPQVGTVGAAGAQSVTPEKSRSYTLIASNSAGTTRALVSVQVILPPPSTTPPSRASLNARLADEVPDAYFDYGRYDLRDDVRRQLNHAAYALRVILSDFGDTNIRLEAHCDQRGSSEYNLALGDRRAVAVKDLLVSLGVPADRLDTLSFGKEGPVCTADTEECWQRNRRVHFAAESRPVPTLSRR